MTLTPVGLALKLPERDRTDLLTTGASPLKYFPKAPIKKETDKERVRDPSR